MDFVKSLAIAAAGLRAQAGRMRVISENIANADSTAADAGGDPYRRRVVDFPSPNSTAPLGVRVVALGPVSTDQSDFQTQYEPGHPAADASGMVKYPNVNTIVEMTDMREAQRSYDANVNIIGATRTMIAAHPRHPSLLNREPAMPTPGIAANAYASSPASPRGARRPCTAPSRNAGRRAGPDFRRPAQEAHQGVDAAGHKSDVQAQALASGKANVIDVVTAVAEAETAVSALVAVATTSMQSYQEVMRMTI